MLTITLPPIGQLASVGLTPFRTKPNKTTWYLRIFYSILFGPFSQEIVSFSSTGFVAVWCVLSAMIVCNTKREWVQRGGRVQSVMRERFYERVVEIGSQMKLWKVSCRRILLL